MIFSFESFIILFLVFLVKPLKCSMESYRNNSHEAPDEKMEKFMIQIYLEKYENIELSNQVQECVHAVTETYIESVKNLAWTNNLERMMGVPPGTVETKEGATFLLDLNQDIILGNGAYGIVLKKSYSKVLKISLGRKSFYNPINEEEMPFEYCVGLYSSTTHILRPLEDSFQPIELPGVLFENKFKMSGYFLKFGLHVTDVSSSIEMETLTIPVVPMFEMPLCKTVKWKHIERPDRTLFELLLALDYVHESGIALMDISPDNIMNCNGEYKFIDLGFVLLYSNVSAISFGNQLYRSPWAHIASKLETEEHQELHLDRKLTLEVIANDYWSLAFIFARELCDFDENFAFTDHIEEVVESKSSKNGIFAAGSAGEINEFLQCYLDDMFFELRLNNHASCTKPLQEILHTVLQVNPVIRMQYVEKLLCTYE